MQYNHFNEDKKMSQIIKSWLHMEINYNNVKAVTLGKTKTIIWITKK